MPRRPAIIPNRHIHTTIPEELAIRVDLILFSDVEGRIPQGAMQGLLVRLLRDHLQSKVIDLAPFLNTPPGVHIVSGPASTISALSSLLQKEALHDS